MQSFRVSFALDTEGWYDSGNNRHTEYEEGCHQTGFTDDGTLYLYFIHTGNIYAGRPYQVKWNSGSDIVNPVFSGITIENVQDNVTSTDEKVGFIGNYSPVMLPGGDRSNYYLGAQNTLYWPTADKTVGAFRAYFHVDLSDVPAGERSSPSEESDDVWYDLSGRKYKNKPAKPGLYIRGGRKVVVN